MNFLIDNVLNHILSLNENYLEKINGELSLVINDIENSIINSGNINISIKEKLIKLDNSLFKINNVGNIKSNFKYFESNGDLIFLSNNILEITNKKEFARKFQISQKKIKNVNHIFFDLEKNIDNGEISISNIYLNKIDKDKNFDEFYIIKNIQSLKSLIREALS